MRRSCTRHERYPACRTQRLGLHIELTTNGQAGCDRHELFWTCVYNARSRAAACVSQADSYIRDDRADSSHERIRGPVGKGDSILGCFGRWALSALYGNEQQLTALAMLPSQSWSVGDVRRSSSHHDAIPDGWFDARRGTSRYVVIDSGVPYCQRLHLEPPFEAPASAKDVSLANKMSTRKPSAQMRRQNHG